MKKVRIPIMVQDPRVAKLTGVHPAEGTDPVRGFFLDGPITDRVAVLDFDPDTGALKPGARFNPGKKLGWFENPSGQNLYDIRSDPLAQYTDEFMQVSVFATVLRTMDLFEKADTLGRPLSWAFDAPQLLIVPQAGQMDNAYYQRESHSLQFFYSSSPRRKDTIYTCLSRDIVAHETGHAIVDGIVPDLLDACTPQSLALHEAIADVVAMLVAFSSHSLSHYLLDKANGDITGQNPFTTIAEEFGAARGHREGLRDLFNDKTLDPDVTSIDENGEPNYVGRLDPHTLSQVLSGALCKVLVEIYDHLKQEEVGKATTVAESRKAWGKALSRASVRFKRMAFRALDFLPPGEVSFADYGRALIAADQVAYPADDKMRQAVRRQFVGRSMVESEVALQMDGDFDYGPLTLIEINALCSSDWVAYQFANANRELLRIPKHIPFEVRPRLRVLKRYDGDRRGEPSGEECIFKVTWSENEDNAGGARLPAQRQIPVGCTLVVHPQTRRVLCRLTSATPPDRPRVGEDRKVRRLRLAERRQQRKDRDGFLRNLVDEGVLRLGVHGLAPDGQPLLSAVRGEVTGEVMRLRGSGNLLHIMRGGESGGHSG